MDELLKTIVINAPNLLGLVVLAYVLYRQNERLLSEVLDDNENLKHNVIALAERVQSLERVVSGHKSATESDLLQPPHTHREPSDMDSVPWDTE